MRRRPDSKKIILLSLFALLAFGPADLYAELQMGAQLADPSISVGDSSYIVVRVAGVPSPAQPTIEVEEGDAAGIRSAFIGSGRQVFRSANKSQDIHSFRFSVAGLKPGTYSLVAAIEHDGETFGTDPVKLTVRPMTDAEKSLAPSFTIEVEKRELFLGEMLPLKLVIATGPRTSPEFHNVAPEIESDGFVMQPLRGLFRAGKDAAGRDRHFFEGNCEALRAGDLQLGPATYPMQLAVRNRSNGRATRRQYKLSAEPITIKVKPLPAEGKPASFAGTVGNFKMDIEASPLKLKQGEPISVTLTIAGEGNLPSIDAPTLSGNAEAWKQYDPSRSDSRDENRNRRNPMAPKSNAGRVTFKHMIVPLETESEIPPFEFSFFNPESRTYKTLRTEPIPIEVTADASAVATRNSNPIVPAQSDPQNDPPPMTPPPLEEMTDILSISAPRDGYWSEAQPPLSQSKWFWALQAPPAAGLLALVFFGLSRRIQERDGTTGWVGAYPPSTEILRSLESGSNSAREFYDGAHKFLQAWQEQNPSASQVSLTPELSESLDQIRDRHNYLSFGAPGGGDDSETLDKDERTQVLNTLRSLPAHAS